VLTNKFFEYGILACNIVVVSIEYFEQSLSLDLDTSPGKVALKTLFQSKDGNAKGIPLLM